MRWHERNGKWEARIFDSNSGKQVSLGYYDSEDTAARAYDAESQRIRGPHAHVNLPAPSAPRPGRPRRRTTPSGTTTTSSLEFTLPEAWAPSGYVALTCGAMVEKSHDSDVPAGTNGVPCQLPTASLHVVDSFALP